MEANDFPVKNHQTGWMIQEAYRLYPLEVTTAIFNRLQAGRDIPYGSKQLLQRAGLEFDEGPVVDLVMDPDTPKDIGEAAATIVGAQTICKLIDEIVTAHATILTSGTPVKESIRKRFWHLSDLISETGTKPFFNAVLNRASTTDPPVIALLAERVIRHHQHEPECREPLEGKLNEQIITAVERWGETLLANPNATRHQLAELTGAIQRLAAPRLVTILRRMLIEDLARWQCARDQAETERKAGCQVNSDSYHSYTNQYRAAFTAIGTAEVIELMKHYLPDAGSTGFGVDAAWVLKEIQERENTTTKDKFFRWGIDFSEVNVKRENRQKGLAPEPSEPAEAMLKVVRNLLQPDAGENNQIGRAHV